MPCQLKHSSDFKALKRKKTQWRARQLNLVLVRSVCVFCAQCAQATPHIFFLHLLVLEQKNTYKNMSHTPLDHDHP